MYNVRKISEELYYLGSDDIRLELFENIHPIQKGISYNSYLLLDEKTVLLDTVDLSKGKEFLEKLKVVLNGRELDYLIVHHVEPDHGAMIGEVVSCYPNVKVIGSKQGFVFMKQFGAKIEENNMVVVKEGDKISFGKHEFTFIGAPMVHWPEVLLSYDSTIKTLFSADAFGTFSCLYGKLYDDDFNIEAELLEEMRKYYTNIVGKFGVQVQNLLKKANTLDIKMICPLHGPIWRTNLSLLLEKYNKWSKYEPEENGVLVVYASMYGNTEKAAITLANKLKEKGLSNMAVYDVSKADVSTLISETFKYSHLVLASPTYNMGVFPLMHNYLEDMKALNVQNKIVGIIENGTWACKAGEEMVKILKEMKNMIVLEEKVKIVSSLNEESEMEIENLMNSILKTL
ncbi:MULTISPECIES: FprA family A-type flavoprotein [Fusobacterium]|uniref:FprA family A-type flavoprotein n=1 Tax=Fusobacterium TaxID=848 RepID=UPI001477462C|nr:MULTISPECIES: FprA family A-type flavoprotein [Fusobacterium]NME36176.1 FprA family A-type flavoprotein [Fusobacterium sp. FSA-380-WT-3A]